MLLVQVIELPLVTGRLELLLAKHPAVTRIDLDEQGKEGGENARPGVSRLGKVAAKGAGRHLTWHWHLSCPTSKALVALARSGTSGTEITDLPDPVLTHGQVRPSAPVSFP